MVKCWDDDPDGVQQAIASERRRHARLERLGQVLRFLWEDLFDRVKARIEGALLRQT